MVSDRHDAEVLHAGLTEKFCRNPRHLFGIIRLGLERIPAKNHNLFE
jgi:hypothetical protein